LNGGIKGRKDGIRTIVKGLKGASGRRKEVRYHRKGSEGAERLRKKKTKHRGGEEEVRRKGMENAEHQNISSSEQKGENGKGGLKMAGSPEHFAIYLTETRERGLGVGFGKRNKGEKGRRQREGKVNVLQRV